VIFVFLVANYHSPLRILSLFAATPH